MSSQFLSILCSMKVFRRAHLFCVLRVSSRHESFYLHPRYEEIRAFVETGLKKTGTTTESSKGMPLGAIIAIVIIAVIAALAAGGYYYYRL